MSQRLKTLRDAGLVDVRHAGRQAHYRAEAKGLAPLIDWIAHHQQFWRGCADKLSTVLREMS